MVADRYNHAFTIAFSVISEKEDGSDVTPVMFRAALEKRMREMDESENGVEWNEATGAPFDTFKEE